MDEAERQENILEHVQSGVANESEEMYTNVRAELHGYVEGKQYGGAGLDQCHNCELYFPQENELMWLCCSYCSPTDLVWYCDNLECSQKLNEHENNCQNRRRSTRSKAGSSPKAKSARLV